MAKNDARKRNNVLFDRLVEAARVVANQSWYDSVHHRYGVTPNDMENFQEALSEYLLGSWRERQSNNVRTK